MKNETEALLDVGVVVGTHGLRGDIKVRLRSGDPELLQNIAQVHLALPRGNLLKLRIIRQAAHKNQILLRFAGYESINLVEPLVGGQLLLRQDQLPDLEDDEYYWNQLDGLQVIDVTRGELGSLVDLFSSSAHDTYIVRGEFGEVLIPAVKQFVQDIDLERRIMRVDLPDGLIQEEQ